MESFRDAQGVHYERCRELEEAYRQLYSTVLYSGQRVWPQHGSEEKVRKEEQEHHSPF